MFHLARLLELVLLVKNRGRFCAAEEMICACVCVCVRERESVCVCRDTRSVDTENTQANVY